MNSIKTSEIHVTYEQALLLKNMGFNWPCFLFATVHDNNITYRQNSHPLTNKDKRFKEDECVIPSQDAAQRWLREKEYMHLRINFSMMTKKYWCTVISTYNGYCLSNGTECKKTIYFATYKDAVSAGIDYMIGVYRGSVLDGII